MSSAKITWTKIDEAPALATHALLPDGAGLHRQGTGVEIETADISLAGPHPRELPRGADARTQRIPDELSPAR